MRQSMVSRVSGIRKTHFPAYLFIITFLSFLLMSGIHTGLIVVTHALAINEVWMTGIVIIYWVIVSLAFTIVIAIQLHRTYELPVKQIAKAANQVANGDFSVYVPPIHTAERLDYLDVMIMDFNRMVEELGSIETLKVDFFSNVSHEIKTPIAVIQNAAELLKKGTITEAEREEYINTIISSTKKLSALITNILKLNKLEKQNIQPMMDEYDLCEQLCSCALQFESIWEEKNIVFDMEIEDKAVLVCDESLLELVWTNLLSNAFKFTEEGGKVTISQITQGEEITVKISDEGCGMSKETMSHIFDKFYQGDTSRAAEGNGLGLALALRIVRMLDGDISVESEVGKGTTFTIKLPVNKSKGDNSWNRGN